MGTRTTTARHSPATLWKITPAPLIATHTIPWSAGRGSTPIAGAAANASATIGLEVIQSMGAVGHVRRTTTDTTTANSSPSVSIGAPAASALVANEAPPVASPPHGA